MQNDNLKFKLEFNKRLIQFALNIIALAALIRKDRNMWVIADQVTDSGTSIGANVREAKASSSKRDYIKFFEIALKSANETCYWLELIIASHPSSKVKSSELLNECNEIANILGAGLLTMKGKR